MGYLGLGDLDSSDFNSTKYPGICKPSNVSSLATFKKLQSQLNRVASMKGVPTIAVDGDIGPGSLRLFASMQSTLVAFLNVGDVTSAIKIAGVSSSSCSSLALVADVVGDAAQKYADSLGAPTTVASPTPAKASTLVLPNGIEKPAPAGADMMAAWTNASTEMKIAFVAVMGGIGYYLYKGSKKRRH